MMQRRHFERISHTIDNLDLDPTTQEYVAKQFADSLSCTNENFDRDRFLRACGIDTEDVDNPDEDVKIEGTI